MGEVVFGQLRGRRWSDATGLGHPDPFRTRRKKSQVLAVLILEQLRAAAHVCAHQFVRGTVELIEFELALPEPQMQKRIADRARAVHRITEGVAPAV